jgi:hypothetical protein
MSTLIESINLGSVTLDIYDSGINHRFSDGVELWAEPQDTDQYRVTALDLGYGRDTLRQCIDHEIGHQLVGLLMGLGRSPTLWAVAHGQRYDYWRQEEAIVFALQRWCTASDTPMLDLAYSHMKGF